ncbi:MAG TPA: hypothetical protein VGJ74_17175 [Burkholderiales bacterium]|jgi:hypothetical protein
MLRFFFPRPLDRHYIDAGRVSCPLRGHDVDFDLCAGCPSMREIELRSSPAFVRCRSEPTGGWLLRTPV